MRALEFSPTLPGYAAARWLGGARGGPLQLLRLAHHPAPELPGDAWVRLRPRLAGVCGSDLACLEGHASPYLGALASAPFVLGHEVVADVADGIDGLDRGTRVVLEPLLHCGVRGVRPPCRRCASGEPQGCESVAGEGLAAGLQTGYCSATGGGWATELVAHRSQVHRIPDDLDDADAVVVEPLACALHAVMRSGAAADDAVLVIGCGTLGLLTIAALRHLGLARRIVAVARHDHQRRLAGALGADDVTDQASMLRTVRWQTGARIVEDRGAGAFLLGGVDACFECTGTADGLRDAMATTHAGGTVVLVGMPGRLSVDLSPAWQRELTLRGAYAYGVETPVGVHAPAARPMGAVEPPRRTFDLAIEAASSLRPGRLVGAPFALEDFREALAEASDAGRRGAVKVAFAPQLAGSR
ncbi:MAG TPA: zinc-binding dehydrogenase [Candidatus Dormibacteraeota bacterium]|nr:zinc-binding dehydrogenase [Candidatus Dormibacteraeota bacterium]